MIKITVESEETRLSDKACKCFSRNPAQVNDLNGVASSTCVWNKFSIPQSLNVESKSLVLVLVLVFTCTSLKLTFDALLFGHVSAHIQLYTFTRKNENN